ncbi:MAG: peptidylprolyl isomerase [Anaerolineae bacterium]|nr:MAG: peptidylprolyl isomerase [Anaerolineae bacterium]
MPVAYALGMRIMPRAMRAGTAALALSVLAAACSLQGGTTEVPEPTATATAVPATATPTPEPAAAYVNGEAITLAAFEREVARFEAANAALGIDLATLGDYRAEVLDQLMDLSLLAQFAVNQGMELSEAELDERFQAVVASAGVPAGYTEDEFRIDLRREILAAKAVGSITDVLPSQVEHTSARHILVATLEEAEALLDDLANGADFGTLAVIHSRDPSTRPAGGELGWFPKGLLTMPEVEEAAFSLQPGEVSDVIETALGFHILEVLGREDRPLVGETLTQYRVAAVQQWLAEQRQRAEIEIFIEG